MKTIAVDIDGTICTQEENYADAKPITERIDYFNKLHDEGNKIVYYTARGSGTGKNWTRVTFKQFKDWGVKHHSIQFGKIPADHYVDDRAINPNTEDLTCLSQKSESTTTDASKKPKSSSTSRKKRVAKLSNSKKETRT